MQTKTLNSLHKIRGTVHAQYVKCGKKNCKCTRGELHGAYYYHFVRVNGKLTKRYLKRDEVEEIATACHIRVESSREIREIHKEDRQRFQELREMMREWKMSKNKNLD